MQQHRHQEFIRFLNTIEREVPAGKDVHAISLCNARSGNSIGSGSVSWCRGMPRHQLPIFGIPWSCNTTVERTNGQQA
jgi:hypothetical protein